MASIIELIFSQFQNLPKIIRIARYENKAAFGRERLGILWQYINPIIQIVTYGFVFIVGLRTNSPVDGVPYLLWMTIGIATWNFMSSVFVDSLDAIRSRVRMISKMKFDLSNLVSIRIIQKIPAFITMLVIIIALAIYFRIYPNFFWLQIFYYLFAAIIFLFAFGVLNASITSILPDYKPAIKAIMRSLFWFSGAIWNIEMLPTTVANILKLNPFFYIINGVRDSIIGNTWFFQHGFETIAFWIFVVILLIIATHVYLKYRDRFVENN